MDNPGFVRKSNRLKTYDYSQPGYYFVTICTQERREYFGEVVDGKIVLNGTGRIVERFWKDIPHHYSLIDMDQFVVMPNHIHGIVIIEPMPADGRRYSLSGIIGSFKNIATKNIRIIQPNFAWQHSFYDHVIRKDESLDKVHEYIVNNPLKWELDRNNPSNLWM